MQRFADHSIQAYLSCEALKEDPKCPMARVLSADCAFCQGDGAKSKVGYPAEAHLYNSELKTRHSKDLEACAFYSSAGTLGATGP